MRLLSTFNIVGVAAGLIISSAVSAATVTGGEFVLDFDETVLSGLPAQIKNSAWFDQAASADKTATTMLNATAQSDVPDAFTFQVFGSMISTPPVGLEGRNPVVSNFNYTGDPTTGTGKIGLAGVHQISSLAGNIVAGDYDLNYDSDRVGNVANGSGWYITNNLSFPLISYDLSNVTTTIIDDNNFSLSGDVALSGAFAQMIQAPDKKGLDVGDFTFTTVVSEAASATYSFKSQLLTLPVVKVANENYTAILKLVDLGGGNFAFDLVSAVATMETSEMPAEYNAATGIVKMPKVALITASGMSGKIKAEMKLIAGSAPLRFMLTTTQNIED